MNFGFASLDARSPIAPETLFQVGSISKLMTAAVLHQFAAEGRIRLTDRVSELLPAFPSPPATQSRSSIYSTMSPDSQRCAALDRRRPLDRLSARARTGIIPIPVTRFSGGWSSSSPATARRVLHDRIFAPLGMTRSRGAIVGDDRTLYAQGYEAADQLPFATGVPSRRRPGST